MQEEHRLSAARQRSVVPAFASLPPILLMGAILLLGCATPRSEPPRAAAILISDRVTAYQQVADALGARLDNVPMYALDGDLRKARGVIARLGGGKDRLPIITIGALATRLAAELTSRPVVFCQYFNSRGPDVGRDSVRGVRATPPALKQLEAWKLLDPRLQRVALVSGPATGEFAQEARAAAARLNIQLEHSAVGSDRELLYATKRIAGGVQGLWLVPDHRVLSVETLRQVLAHALRQGRQTLVFSSQLLPYGGLLSVESDPVDIAERVLEQLYASGNAPRIAPLQHARVRINIEVARQLGLEVPAALQEGTYVF